MKKFTIKSIESNVCIFSYYRCSRYKTLCPGRCVVEETKIRNCTEHNHPPEPDRVLVDKFRKVLTQRATAETTDLYTIYLEEASQRHPDAALLYTFTAAESAMRKARRKQLPQVPSNVCDLEQVLTNTNSFRIHSGCRRDPFFQTTLTLNDESSCVIFMHLQTVELLGHIEEIHINDAINIKFSHHLLIVHAVKNFDVRTNHFTKIFVIIVLTFWFPFTERSNIVCNKHKQDTSHLCGHFCIHS